MLPVSLTSIIGRESLVTQIRSLFDTGNARIVTLTGPGGIGKTRLALEVATLLQGDYADGAAFASLIAEHDARQAPAAIADALGIRTADGAEIDVVLTTALQQRHLLLVLDNLEQITPGITPWLAGLLARCPRLHVLAASRVALRISGEHRVAVPPLPVAASSPHMMARDARESPAVQLFVQRATEARDDFTLTDTNAAAIATICQRLDGMPLAIELAAARVIVMSPAALLQRLDEQGDILSDQRLDLPDRHRTITRAIAWSHDLLTHEEKRLFRRLAVFIGGFSLDAVEAIDFAEDPPAASVVDILQSLVHHSLIVHTTAPDDEVRLRMLEPIRSYALAHLAAADEEPRARDAHAAWCMELAERAWVGMKGRDQVAWIDRLELEHANFREATTWLLRSDRVEDAIAMSLRLSLFRHLHGHVSDLAGLYDRFLAHPRVTTPGLARGQALLCRGSLAQTQYDPSIAVDTLEEAVMLLQAHGAREDEAAAQWLLGNVHRFTEDVASAESRFTACLDIGRSLDDSRLIGVGLSHVGITQTMRGELDHAESLLQDARNVAEAAGDIWVMSMVWIHLAQAAIARGDDAAAEARFRDAEPLIRALGDRVGLLRLRVMIAEMAGRAGNHTTSDAYFDESLADAWALGDKASAARILLERGRRAAQRGDRTRALADIGASIRLHDEMAQPTGVARCLGILATLALEAGNATEAARLLGMVDARLRAAGIELASGPPEIKACRAQLNRCLDEQSVRAAYAAGLALAHDQAIAEAVSLVLPGATRPEHEAVGVAGSLTQRELDVLRLLADGLTNEDIADALFISTRTVAGHVANILAKLELRTRTAAVAWAIRNGIA